MFIFITIVKPFVLFFLLFLYTLQGVWAQDTLKYHVYFDTDKYAVPTTEKSRLLQYLSQLDSLPIAKINIYGFCDDRGTDHYNLKLSLNRAQTIKSILTNQGIADSLIFHVDGKGEVLLKKINEKSINAIRGLNRKVEINVIKKKVTTEVKKDSIIIKEPKKTVLKNKKPTLEDILKGTIKRGDKIRLDNIYFKVNYSYITSNSRKTLEEITKILKKHDYIHFTIQGHVCCTRGSQDAIDKRTRKRNLSVARAKFIFDYFNRRGISKKRMRYVGLRKRFPLGGDPKFDRRVEILITRIDEQKRKSFLQKLN